MDNKQKIIIFGAGGHGKVVLDILLEASVNVLGFLDDNKDKASHKIRAFDILGDWSYIEDKSLIGLALGIGNNSLRYKIFKEAKDRSIAVVPAIHPKAVVSKDVKIGEGVVIMPGAVVNPGSVLEDGVVVNTGATVDHDCHLEKFCQIWPGAHLAGSVRVGEFSYVGTGAAVIQNINIGKNVMIGAGAVIISDVPSDVTIAGDPGRIIKHG